MIEVLKTKLTPESKKTGQAANNKTNQTEATPLAPKEASIKTSSGIELHFEGTAMRISGIPKDIPSLRNDVLRTLRDHPEIVEYRFSSDISPETKRMLSEIIAQNYPLL